MLVRHFYRISKKADIERADRRGRTLDLHAARMTIYARGAAAGIPVEEVMQFV